MSFGTSSSTTPPWPPVYEDMALAPFEPTLCGRACSATNKAEQKVFSARRNIYPFGSSTNKIVSAGEREGKQQLPMVSPLVVTMYENSQLVVSVLSH